MSADGTGWTGCLCGFEPGGTDMELMQRLAQTLDVIEARLPSIEFMYELSDWEHEEPEHLQDLGWAELQRVQGEYMANLNDAEHGTWEGRIAVRTTMAKRWVEVRKGMRNDAVGRLDYDPYENHQWVSSTLACNFGLGDWASLWHDVEHIVKELEDRGLLPREMPRGPVCLQPATVTAEGLS